ncbi:MAG: phosphoethanolamine--lipid A transferase [Haliea sp.]|uniref:phosphoethanolamine transferase n=1 Tax=Haliea sp. TaxID=1932666 RepID=UPI0032EEA5E2
MTVTCPVVPAYSSRGWPTGGRSTALWTRGPELSPELLALLVSAMFALFYNDAFWRSVITAQHPVTLQIIGYGMILVAAQFLLMLLLLGNFYARAFIALWILVAAGVSYFTDNYGIYFDVDMVDNILQTDRREAGDLLTWHMAEHFLLYGLLPCFALYRIRIPRLRWQASLRRRAIWIVASIVILAVALVPSFQGFSTLMRNEKALRFLITPANYMVATTRVLAASDPGPAVRLPVGEDVSTIAHTGDRPLLMVIVVGETVRAANWGLNGYSRQTTPLLAQTDAINFQNVSSCGTSTAVSLPCMFSAAGRADYDKRYASGHESLLDVLQRAGMSVLWLDNQSGCKGVCDGVENRKVAALDYPELCPDGECLDGVLLEELVRQLGVPGSGVRQDTVVVLHQMGNHGPGYYKRYPDSLHRFRPTCDADDLTLCTREQIVNSYDNAVLATDALLAGVIGYLERQSDYVPAMLYVSDHGESLGEMGIYLHGLPYFVAPDEQTRVPMVWWSRADFDSAVALDKSCLRDVAAQPLSHDNIFSSVLAMLGLHSQVIDPDLDITGNCG